MSLATKAIIFTLSLVAVGTFAGCQQQPDKSKDGGTYTAARHRMTGSNIPQPDTADTGTARYDPDQFQNLQNQRTSQGLR